MSDTPRTDAVYCDALNDSAMKVLDALMKLTMQLERELAAAQAENERLCNERDAARNDRDLWFYQNNKAQEENAKLQAEIDEWKIATGLEGVKAGDPSSVTPKHLRDEIAKLHEELRDYSAVSDSDKYWNWKYNALTAAVSGLLSAIEDAYRIDEYRKALDKGITYYAEQVQKAIGGDK